MKSLKRTMLVLCALIMALGLVACTNGNNADSKSTSTAAQDKSVTYPVTVTGSDGSKVTLDSEPQKVVSMAPNITELMFKLGVQDKLVGRTDYCLYPAEASAIPSVGTLQTPDIEKIISLNPDVVIASTHFSLEIEKKLTDLGVKVVILYEEHDINGVYTIMDTLGTIFNIRDKSAETASEMKASIEETTTAVSGLEKPSVYYVIGFGEYGDYTAGKDTFIGQLISLAGGTNIANDISGWTYSLESLIEADPEIIIIANDMKDSFMQAQNYKDLSAVKNGKVYGVDKNILELQGDLNAQGVRTLAQLFHPEAFK